MFFSDSEQTFFLTFSKIFFPKKQKIFSALIFRNMGLPNLWTIFSCLTDRIKNTSSMWNFDLIFRNMGLPNLWTIFFPNKLHQN